MKKKKSNKLNYSLKGMFRDFMLAGTMTFFPLGNPLNIKSEKTKQNIETIVEEKPDFNFIEEKYTFDIKKSLDTYKHNLELMLPIAVEEVAKIKNKYLDSTTFTQLFLGVIKQESLTQQVDIYKNLIQNKKSGATGASQLMPIAVEEAKRLLKTYNEYSNFENINFDDYDKLDLEKVRANLAGGAMNLSHHLTAEKGNIHLALARYNKGPTMVVNLEKTLGHNYKALYSHLKKQTNGETTTYVSNITSDLKIMQKNPENALHIAKFVNMQLYERKMMEKIYKQAKNPEYPEEIYFNSILDYLDNYWKESYLDEKEKKHHFKVSEKKINSILEEIDKIQLAN